MDREEFLNLLSGIVLSHKLENFPLKVAIDGRGAAGKSTLADELAVRLNSTGLQVLRPSVDGFHHPQERRYRQGEFSAQGYYQDAFDYEAVIDKLLRPLSGDTFPVLCHQTSLDLRTDLPADALPVSASATAILLFDGVFVLRRELNPYWDLRILVDVDPEIAVSRALVRDSGLIGSAELTRRKYDERYEPAWQIYLKTELPQSRADIIVDNSDVTRPKILKGIARV